jgi:hypothetical protein
MREKEKDKRRKKDGNSLTSFFFSASTFSPSEKR